MSNGTKFQPSEKGQIFLDSVRNGKYDRQIINGLKSFIDGKAPEDMQAFYSSSELKALADLKGTIRDVEARMPVKITRHYFELAKKSEALKVLVKASPKETVDLDGAPDPGKQMSYSPVEGLIHKYELGLIYVASTCSAHCRFCYREELRSKGRMGPSLPKAWQTSVKLSITSKSTTPKLLQMAAGIQKRDVKNYARS
jgi:L-lysine 2,3-aminomutase